MKTIQIQMNDYHVLFQWTQTLATQEFASIEIKFITISTKKTYFNYHYHFSKLDDFLFSRSLLKFFIFITWSKNSSAALMKYACTDIVRFFDTYIPDQEIGSAIFNFLSEKNSQFILNVIFDELTNITNSFEWLLSYKAKFEVAAEISNFYKQIMCVMQSLHSLIISNLPPTGQVQENLIKLIIKFYNFMISLSKHVSRIFFKCYHRR